MYTTYHGSSDQQQLEAAEKQRAGRSEVSYRTDVTSGGCNTIHSGKLNFMEADLKSIRVNHSCSFHENTIHDQCF